MKQTKNSVEVKRLNRNRVFRYINSTDETSMPEISAALNISGPTVLTMVNELKEKGVIKESGELQSTGGRKAKALTAVRNVVYALGVDLTKNHIGIVYTDLSEKALKHERIRKPFVDSNQYLREVADILNQFIEKYKIPREKIVGMGISIPAIVDGTRNMITNSRIFNIFNVSCEEWASYFPYPCEFLNDANAAAITESICCKKSGNMVYLSLSNTVGGAILFQNGMDILDHKSMKNSEWRNLYVGDNWRSAEFGHMVIHPDGERCYCGKRGCLDVYCSALRLANLTGGNLEEFFREMEAGNSGFRKVWREYLRNLAIAIDNLRMCFDCEIVLGGYVGSQMGPYIQELRKLVSGKNIFDVDGNYVRACRYQSEASALGAGIYQIENFIRSI